jgi:hypothetical protein
MERPGGARIFECVTPSAADVARAAELPVLTACPRRYCWWWQSLGFDWDTPVATGCRLSESPKPPGFRFAEVPCCRLDPASGVDHYEPREPHLEADGFDRHRFCGPQHSCAGCAGPEPSAE